MKIMLIASKTAYDIVKNVGTALTNMGNEVVYPNCFDNPGEESTVRPNQLEHRKWKQSMYRHSIEAISKVDALLVVNPTILADDKSRYYIGGATLLEMYEGFRQDKPIYILYKIPECSYKDELNGLVTEVLDGNINYFFNK